MRPRRSRSVGHTGTLNAQTLDRRLGRAAPAAFAAWMSILANCAPQPPRSASATSPATAGFTASRASEASSLPTTPDASTAGPSNNPYVYRGTVAERPVVLRLTCDGSCSGYYFYENIGESLRLSQVKAGTFDEIIGFGGRSRVTGQLAFDGPPGAQEWRGRWTTPGGRTSGQPIVLTRVPRAGVPSWVKRALVESSAKTAECRVIVHSFELLGLADTVMEERINSTFAPARLAEEHLQRNDERREDGACGKDGSRCDDSVDGARVLCRAVDGRSGLSLENEVHPTVLSDRVLSVRSEYYFDGGGAHPSDGVAGLTVDLRDGHELDAHDLLTDPAHPPGWLALVSPSFDAGLDGPEGRQLVSFSLPSGSPTSRAPVWEKTEWADYYLTPSGIALVPQVPEAFRALRHRVQEIPFARIRGFMRADGPAAQLWKPQGTP